MNQKRLKQLLDYDPDTGVFSWKVRRRRIKIGDIVRATNRDGYICMGIDYKTYLVHRLAWLYVHGEFPEEIDHINHDRADNRICNLRGVTRVENRKNQLIHRNNTSGVAGVYWNKRDKKWVARIKVNGKFKGLGIFDDINLAKQAREQAKIKYGFHPNHA